MPRRKPRFSQLERQYRDSGGTAEAGSRLAGYIKFKKGETKITVEKKLTSAQRKRYAWAILPFGVSPASTPTAADRYAAPITAYSNAARADLGLTNTECGYETVDAATNRDDNFYSAVMRVFVGTGGAPTTPKSGVTGKDYTRIPGNTYSFPFGRVLSGTKDKKTAATETALDAVDEEDVKAKLSTLVKSKPNVRSVSFLAEEFKVGKPDLVSPPST
ncbi:hypothetical protein [Scytonema sp. NUACC26]|uniref:hypothetical protein n=1 Tax=Scytonema sp. NUACC26 TaxID=3140176 RepID=UPI0034DC9819